MGKSTPTLRPDLERIIEFDLVRATAPAALPDSAWMGKDDKSVADQATGDAIRGMFDLIPWCGEVLIGDSPLLPGVRFVGHTAVTHSLLMRARTRPVRSIKAVQDLSTKTIRLRSTRAEQPL